MKIKVKSIENYIKEKKDSGKKLLFLEKVGDRNTSREKLKENLIKVLEAKKYLEVKYHIKRLISM